MWYYVQDWDYFTVMRRTTGYFTMRGLWVLGFQDTLCNAQDCRGDFVLSVGLCGTLLYVKYCRILPVTFRGDGALYNRTMGYLVLCILCCSLTPLYHIYHIMKNSVHSKSQEY